MSFLEFKKINKAFGKNRVLKDLSLTIDEGDLVTILGPSGCGKSTLLKIGAGIIGQDSGEIFLKGREISSLKTHKRNIIMVHQDLLLFPHLNVGDNIGYSLKVRGYSKGEIERRVDELLDLVELPSFNKKSTEDLSGGEKQRVALARTLAANPHVILLDEPFSALDAGLKDKIIYFTKSLIKREKITTILVTHDKNEALMLSNKIAFMDKGSILSYDSPINLLKDPKYATIARLLGFDNIVDGRVIPIDSISLIENPLGDFMVEESYYSGLKRTIILKNLRDSNRLKSEVPLDYKIEEKKRYDIKVDEDRVIKLRG